MNRIKKNWQFGKSENIITEIMIGFVKNNIDVYFNFDNSKTIIFILWLAERMENPLFFNNVMFFKNNLSKIGQYGKNKQKPCSLSLLLG